MLIKFISRGRSTSVKRTMSLENGLPLSAIVKELEKFAPSTLAEKWDNVGLLIEPFKQQTIKKILLTNDLTHNVFTEAVDRKINMIISYHPPIFKPLQRFVQSHWKERIVSGCIFHNIALYSPHTAWDKINGGVNDWLASALPIESIKPLEEETDAMPGSGIGRILITSTDINSAVSCLQKHINNNVHLALAIDHNINTKVRTVALCAGSAASILRRVRADLIITGEMSHHEVLDFNHNGSSVLLCNHSNSERGFLKHFKSKLREMLNGECEVELSLTDKDPLSTIFSN